MVSRGRGAIGTLDMREWVTTIAAVDAEVKKTIEAGLFSLTAERHVLVVDVFDDLRELVATAGEWAGTLVPPALERKIATTSGEVQVHQDVRMRVLVKRGAEARKR